MTTDTLDFPPIEAAPPQTSVATSIAAAITPIDLTKIELTAVALAQYGDWRKDVAATKANLSTLVLDLSTPTKIKEARTLRQRLIGDPLAAVRKVATGIKSKMAQTSKAVGAELEQIEAAYAEADKLILPQIEKREEELEREREEARQREEARKERHRTNIEAIRIYADRASVPGMTAERIARGITLLEAIPTPTTEAWEEFAVPAANAICETLEKMRALHAKALADEAAAAEAERVRKENEELRARLAAAEAAAAAAREPKPPTPGEFMASLVPNKDTPQQGANRDASAGQSHVAEGSASPAGRGADGPTACGAAPVSLQASERITLATIEQGAARIDATASRVERAAGSLELGAAFDALAGLTDLAPVIRAPGGPFTLIEPAAAPADPDEKPTFKLGELQAWLAPVKIDADGLLQLGIACSRISGTAKLYKPSDKARIKAALIEWLERLA